MSAPLALVVSAADNTCEAERVLMHLGSLGFRCVAIDDGDSAARIALALHPPLVLADVRLPRKNGLQLCRIIRSDAASAATAIVLFADAPAPALRDWARAQGADLLVPRRLHLGAVSEEASVQRIVSAARRARPRSPSIPPVGGSSPEVSGS